jgi:hypothetical protein
MQRVRRQRRLLHAINTMQRVRRQRRLLHAINTMQRVRRQRRLLHAINTMQRVRRQRRLLHAIKTMQRVRPLTSARGRDPTPPPRLWLPVSDLHSRLGDGRQLRPYSSRTRERPHRRSLAGADRQLVPRSAASLSRGWVRPYRYTHPPIRPSDSAVELLAELLRQTVRQPETENSADDGQEAALRALRADLN